MKFGKTVIMVLFMTVTLGCNHRDRDTPQQISNTTTDQIEVINPAIQIARDSIQYDKRITKDDMCSFLGLIDENNILVRNHTAGGYNCEEFWILRPHEDTIYKKIKMKKGSQGAPSEVWGPVNIDKFDKLIFLWDAANKIMVFDEDFNWRLTHRTKNLMGIDFYRIDNDYFFLAYDRTYGEKKVTINLDIFTLNPYRQGKSPYRLRTVFSGKKKYFRHIRIKNRVPLKAIWPEIYTFEQGGKIYYSDSKSRVLNIFNIRTNETRRIEFTHLKGKIFNESELTIDNFSSRYRSERSKKRRKQIRKLIYSKEPVYHYGIIKGGADYIGLFSNIDIKDWRIRLDIFKIDNDVDYFKSIELPIPTGVNYACEEENTTALLNILLNVDEGFICYSAWQENGPISEIRYF